MFNVHGCTMEIEIVLSNLIRKWPKESLALRQCYRLEYIFHCNWEGGAVSVGIEDKKFKSRKVGLSAKRILHCIS